MTKKAMKEARQLALDELLRIPTTNYTVGIDTFFPEELDDQLARQETFNKHLYRPNTYLHKWWARRCGSTFRAILKQFAPELERRDYYASGGLEGKTVLDPMMGGGTTLHEAIRLGANVIGADIDPIPIVQARASLTQASLKDLQAAFHRFFEDLYQRVGPYFQTECPDCERTIDAQYTLYGLRKRCGCGEVVQLDQYELRQEEERVLRIWPESWEISDTTRDPKGQPKGLRLITKTETACPTCKQKYQELLNIPFYARYTPVAIVGDCPEHGIFFRSPSMADLERICEADQQRGILDFGRVDDFAVKDGPKSGDLISRNIHSYLDVFSSRQLLYLYHSIELLQDYHGVAKLNLALLVSTSLEFNSLLCGYKGWFKRRPGAIRHVFALHAYAFQYTVAENNPLNRGKSSGNLQLLFRDRVVRGRKWAVAPVERKIDRKGEAQVVKIPGEWDGGSEVSDQAALATARQGFWLIHRDSRRLPIADHSVDFIVTDPPYYDNVQYSNLAAFFRVWLARLLPSEINWAYDETQSAVAAKATDNDSGFMTVISGIFRESGRVLKRHTGRLVFTFHHWDPNAWAELNIALKHTGFKLLNSYVVSSEHPVSVHINNLNSIKHDTILVLALDGDLPSGQWPAPTKIDTNESENFCRQCGVALGWLLESEYSPAEIRLVWQDLIQGRN
jgi:DNA modification methylase